jgi:hypothetical protein
MPSHFLWLVPLLAVVAPALALADDSDRGSVVLEWTAPGDDGAHGTALMYDIRYSTRPLTDDNFELATVAMFKEPKPAGSFETCTITGLLPDGDYFFAVRTMDHAGNWSSISNVVVRLGRGLTARPERAFAITDARPNPARSRARFGVTVPNSGETARIEVFDAAGRRVRAFSAEGTASETSQVEWNLTDENNAPVSAGVYLVRAQFKRTVLLRRVAVVR